MTQDDLADAVLRSRNPEAQFTSTSIANLWRNPLTVAAEYRASGFEVTDTLFFHWHAVPPSFEACDPAAFRRESLALEWNPHDWRGHFMASAFLLVAERR